MNSIASTQECTLRMTTRLLIDADVLIYKIASSVEVATEWEPGYWTWFVDENLVKQKVDEQIDYLLEKLDADAYTLCLTDSGNTFRHKILPTYKGKRSSVKKPLALLAIRQWLVDEREAVLKPGLEGDDVMGILATKKSNEQRIIVSIDKDMKTIPGLYVRSVDDGMVEITEQEADYWHLFQTLTGDQTDGYSGCPGIGAKKAEELLTKAPTWETVVKVYEGKGLTEHDALVQARVARILRASDYDFKKKEPILWNPTK